MEKRKIKLVKNTVILAIGNFSSKLLSFILLPLYTVYLTPTDYGKVDIYITILAMLYTIVSLQSIESVFRFIQDCKTETEKAEIFSNAIAIALTGLIIFSFGMLIIGNIIDFKYSWIFILHVTTNILYNLFLHTLRGLGKMSTYAVMGVISTIIQAACNILFIVGIGIGALSLILSPIITNLILIIIIIINSKILKYCKLSIINISGIRDQLKFSLPLIPNALCVWLSSSLGRYILLFYYSTEEVGLLAFSLKFPQLLGIVNGIFFMAWQMSAISEYKSEDKDKFASEIFNQYSRLLLSIIIILLPITKISIFTIIGKSYLEAWVYIPIFFCGTVFNSYASFFNMGFFGAKKTLSIFYSSLILNIVYIIFGLLLTKYLYIFGIGIAYTISELVYWLVIKLRVKQYMDVKIELRPHLYYIALLILFLIVYYTLGLAAQVIASILGISIVSIANMKIIKKLFLASKLLLSENKVFSRIVK